MISILFALISRLPLSVLIFLAHVFARVMIFSNSAQYKVTKKNIYYCYEKDTQLVKKSFYETAELLMIFPYICGRTENYKNLIDKDSLEQVQFDSEKPKLFFTLHMGCVDLNVYVLSEALEQINVLYTPAKNKSLDRLLMKARESLGAKMMPANQTGITEIYKSFLGGKNTLIASDLVPHNKGVYEKFFNKECYCLDIVEKLSHKNSHELFFIYLSKGKSKKYKIVLEKISSPLTTAQMNRYFERAIKEAPELYGWEYKKFRKLRGELKNIY